MREVGLGAGDVNENQRILKAAVEKSKAKTPDAQAESSGSGGNGDRCSAHDISTGDEVVEPGANKFKTTENLDDIDPYGLAFCTDWSANGIAIGPDLPLTNNSEMSVGDMEIDDEKANQKCDDDWKEFTKDLGDLPPKLQEALSGKMAAQHRRGSPTEMKLPRRSVTGLAR